MVKRVVDESYQTTITAPILYYSMKKTKTHNEEGGEEGGREGGGVALPLLPPSCRGENLLYLERGKRKIFRKRKSTFTILKRALYIALLYLICLEKKSNYIYITINTGIICDQFI